MKLTDIQEDADMVVGFHKTITVIARECGQLATAILYGNLQTERDPAYVAEAKMAVADLFTQCRILAELLDADWEQLVRLGEERFLERAEERKRGQLRTAH